jgi:anti-sigma B factor antagonist
MEPHLATSTVGIATTTQADTTDIATSRTNAVSDTHTYKRPVRNKPGSVSSSVKIWMHTLILSGELTHRSAHTLEAAIERLCEQGVTGITLDLRQLEHIDSIGVAVIAFRCGLCQRQGYGFALIPGSRLVQRAFEQAGVADLLPFQEDEIAARRLRSSVSGAIGPQSSRS